MENIIEVQKDVYVDKEVKVKKVVEVPVVNPIIKRVPREKVVEVIQEVVKPVVVEVDEYTKDTIQVPLHHSMGRLQVNERHVDMAFHRRVKKSHLSERQVAEFESSSHQVADAQAKNEMLKKEIEMLRQN